MIIKYPKIKIASRKTNYNEKKLRAIARSFFFRCGG